MMIKIAIAALSCCLLTTCHPLVMFRPKAVVNAVKPSLSIALDSYGIPYIKSSELLGAIYGLGYMHARDRLFQLDMTRHAALGRLSELFGAKVLSTDRQLRLLSYKLHEQMSFLTAHEQAILKAYTQGVNDGARQRKKSAEHFFLGIEFEDLMPEHVVAMARLQAWILGGNLMAELSRLSLARSGLSQETLSVLIAPSNDRNSAIIKSTKEHIKNIISMPDYMKNIVSNNIKSDNIISMPGGDGASNAWVVSSKLMNDQKAVLMNDPHLRHNWPSNFYIATLESDDMNGIKVQGASLVGLPTIVIGASDTLAWGVTAAYVNTQDAVFLKTDDEDHTIYWVEDKRLELEPWPQEFCLNKKNKCQKELFFTSIFGPIIDHSFDKNIALGDKLAIQWTAFLSNYHNAIATPFIDLAKARTVFDAVAVTKTMTLPAINIVFADKEHNIGFAYAGLIPMRDKKQGSLLPLDGSLSSSLWSGVSAAAQKPALINPPEGYIITANQNIFSSQSDPDLAYGQQGSSPYRALQIRQRFDELLAKNTTLDYNNLALIQTDDKSLEAQELASHLGQICSEHFKDDTGSRKEFARLLKNFDAHFSTQSLGALPFVMMMQALTEKKFGLSGSHHQISFLMSDALYQKFNNQENPLLANIDIHDFVSSCCEPAYQHLIKKATSTPWKWRWGRHHYLQRQSPLAQAPIIGGLFRDIKREVAGHASTPLAESGLPVINGANLRFLAVMDGVPQIRLIIDSGNSGVVGHPNAFDQVTQWHQGKTISLPQNWEQAQSTALTTFKLRY